MLHTQKNSRYIFFNNCTHKKNVDTFLFLNFFLNLVTKNWKVLTKNWKVLTKNWKVLTRNWRVLTKNWKVLTKTIFFPQRRPIMICRAFFTLWGHLFWSMTGRKNEYQKQPSRDVLRKRYSENMQQIYRRKPMPKYDFALRHRYSPVNLLHIFTTRFPKKTSERLLRE